MQKKYSHNANLILKKLKKTLKIRTDIELSEILNVRPNTISTWKKRNTLDYTTIISICELYEVDLNELFLDKKKSSDASYNFDTPLVSSELQFQYCVDNEGLLENLPKYNFPFIRNEDSRVFQVSSNNMYPVIEQNSFVICELTTIDTVKDGSIVVIVSKNKGFFINKIKKDETNETIVVLLNENNFFNSIPFNISDMDEVWMIKGILSYNLKNEERYKAIEDIPKKKKEL